MKYLRYTCHGNLYADAECKKGNELVNDLIPYRPEFLNNSLPLGKKDIKYGCHTNYNKCNHKIIDSGLQQFTFDAGRSHQSKYNGYTARTDADGKRDGIKYPGFDCPQADGIGVFLRYAAGRSVGVAEPLQRRAADQQTAAQLDDRQRQIEERQHEMSDGQTSQTDQQVVGDDPSDDGFACILVQPRQKPVHEESRSYGIRHWKQRHEGGYEHEDRAF